MANGRQLKTVPFSDQRCVHTSQLDQLLCATLIVSSNAEGHFRLSKQQEVPLISSRSTEDLRVYWDLMMSLKVRSRLKSVLRSAEVAYSFVKSPMIDEFCNGHAMELRLYTIQHNLLPVALVFYRKQNVKLSIWLNGEC